MTKRKAKKKGQVVIEYALVVGVIVFIVSAGFSMLKCYLHQIWIKVACDVIYPYPINQASDKFENEFCGYIEVSNCMPFKSGFESNSHSKR